MIVDFPNDSEGVVKAKAEASGFGNDVAGYLLHLVTTAPTATDEETMGENALEAFEKLGLVGCIKDGPDDLATNPKHMEGFGTDGQQRSPD